MAAHLTEDVWVLPQVSHDGSFLFSFLEPMLLETFAGNVGRDPPRAPSRSGPRDTLSGKADAASVHPWVRDHLVRKLGGGTPAHPLKRPRISEPLHTEELDEVSLREIHTEVEGIRLEWLREHGTEDGNPWLWPRALMRSVVEAW